MIMSYLQKSLCMTHTIIFIDSIKYELKEETIKRFVTKDLTNSDSENENDYKNDNA